MIIKGPGLPGDTSLDMLDGLLKPTVSVPGSTLSEQFTTIRREIISLE